MAKFYDYTVNACGFIVSQYEVECGCGLFIRGEALSLSEEVYTVAHICDLVA